MNQREELAENERIRKEQQCAAALNARQHIVQALRLVAYLSLDEDSVEANKNLVQANARLAAHMTHMEPRQDGKPKGKGRIIDVDAMTPASSLMSLF